MFKKLSSSVLTIWKKLSGSQPLFVIMRSNLKGEFPAVFDRERPNLDDKRIEGWTSNIDEARKHVAKFREIESRRAFGMLKMKIMEIDVGPEGISVMQCLDE